MNPIAILTESIQDGMPDEVEEEDKFTVLAKVIGDEIWDRLYRPSFSSLIFRPTTSLRTVTKTK